ncbi:hypothetical protein [Terribacillus halophilus]|nr:hypothetical protein [Terribacillus halophilus]
MGREQEEAFDKCIGNIVLGSSQDPEDVAKFVSYLSSEDSNYMTG